MLAQRSPLRLKREMKTGDQLAAEKLIHCRFALDATTGIRFDLIDIRCWDGVDVILAVNEPSF